MKHSPFTFHLSLITSAALFLAVFLFFGLAYPHHLHYQEQFQLFLYDSDYVWEIVKQPGGVADLLGRFCTQFFLFAWVGAVIIAVLLVAVQLLTLQLFSFHTSQQSFPSPLRGEAGVGSVLHCLSFVPSFLLWLFLLDEHALMGGVWAVLLTLLAIWIMWIMGTVLRDTIAKGNWIIRTVPMILIALALPILYWMVGPNWNGTHYYRYPSVTPTLLYAAWLSAILLPLAFRMLATVLRVHTKVPTKTVPSVPSVRQQIFHFSLFIFTFLLMMMLVWKSANFKAEKVMQYDFMACHQQWNRILATATAEKPNNQIGVTVQNLALAMHGLLADHLFDYHQNGIAGLLPDVQSDATSPMPTAEAFYQLGMVYVAQRTVFEAQEAILDFQKSGRCYKRLAQTNLIIGSYEVSRKYLTALQKTLFYRDWANETLPLLGNEEAIAKHPEYGHLRRCAYQKDFYFSDHVTAEMLESLYYGNTENRLALEYLKAYYMLTGNREGYTKLLQQLRVRR